MALCCLAEASPDDMAKDGNSDSEWRPDGCDQELAAEGSPDLEDSLVNSMYHGNEPIDEGTSAWAGNVASGGCDAGASGWVGSGFKNIDTDGSQQNGPGPGDLPATDSLRSTDRRSYQFVASVVINTGNKERCECQCCNVRTNVGCLMQVLWL